MRVVLAIFAFCLSALDVSAVEVFVTLDGKPVRRQMVRAITFENGEAKPLAESPTSASGIVSFKVPNPSGKFVAVVTEFEGVPYFVAPIPAETKRITLVVHRSTEDLQALKIEDLRIYAKEREEGLQIEQEIVIRNAADTTVRGPFQIDLPKNSYELQFVSGFREEDTQVQSNTILLTRAFYPGITRLSLRFGLESKRGAAAMAMTFNIPVQNISLSSPYLTPWLAGKALVAEPTRKWADDDWSALYSASLPSTPREVSLVWKGLAWNIQLHHWLPWILAALLLGLIALILRFRSESSNGLAHQRQTWLRELGSLQRSAQLKLVSDEEYQLQRLQLLEKLIPEYYGASSATERHSDSA